MTGTVIAERQPSSLPEGQTALVAAVARGDETAFAALYRSLAGPVYGLALRLLRSAAHAEEVTQEVLLEVWRTAPAYRPERGTVLTWALTIAHHRAVDRVRSVRASSDRELRFSRQDQPLHGPETDQVEHLLDADRVRSALAELTAPQRESLVLAYYGGYSQREIAALLGVPLGTVKTRMRDGLRRLRPIVGP
ncbi:sigma-70 family RNA polymerase sigma factor [Kitasatospora sp. NPDC001664]|uniref:sigma-70 family RNA polymerase sigma factor n=1 Tax=Kitasatospora albolonga TaxID=68173 RepID=UPI0031EC99FD